MSRKSKGINAERELVHLFWSKGWPCVRVAGSGSSRYPSPDILAGNRERMVAIECKTIKAKVKYFEKQEIEALKSFALQFGAEPWVGLKFSGQGWLFLSLDSLKDSGKCFAASLDCAQRCGLTADELIGIFQDKF
jgi:holliday junction resolvase Hjr